MNNAYAEILKIKSKLAGRVDLIGQLSLFVF